MSESQALKSIGSSSRKSAVSMDFTSASETVTEGASRSSVNSSRLSSVRSSRSRRSSRSKRKGGKKKKGKPLDQMDEVSEASNEESELGVMRESQDDIRK